MTDTPTPAPLVPSQRAMELVQEIYHHIPIFAAGQVKARPSHEWPQRLARFEAEIRAEQSSPAGDMDRPAILAAARAWWAASMPMSICRSIQISGDGRVNVHWQDADESGKYTLPVGFFNRSNPGADVERLRAALQRFVKRFGKVSRTGNSGLYDDVQFAREALANPTRAENAQVRGDDISEIVAPWADFHGELPDYDHPLRCVFESGVQYAVELLAKELEVEDYDICDGTEEFDGDLGGTMMNIVRASLPENADGERMWPSEVAAAPRIHPTTGVSGDGGAAVAAERERCAKICDREATLRIQRAGSNDSNWGDPSVQIHKSVTAKRLATAIRQSAKGGE